jgi:acetyl esterase/lipase
LRLGSVLLGVTAAALLFVSSWIVLPAPHLLLLPLAVGAPELSPLLLALSLLVLALAVAARGIVGGKFACACSLLAAVVCAWPLLQLPAAVQRFDQALQPYASAASGRRPLSVTALLFGIDAGQTRVTRGIAVAATDGSVLTLDVYRPPEPGRFPIIVQIYGGAWQRGVPGDNAVFARHFAARGHVVFAIDYRHAPLWQWPAQIDDVRAALAWIRLHAAEYDGDQRRIALIGRSSGAQLALLAAYQNVGPAVAAVVGLYGPTDLARGWREPPHPDPLNVRSVLEAYLGGTPEQMPQRYREASPITHVAATAPPTLLIYGQRDHIVEARFGRDLHQRLRAAGATSVLLELPWSEHAFDAVPGGLAGQLSLASIERFLAQAAR